MATCRTRCSPRNLSRVVRTNLLLFLTIGGFILGISVGFGVRPLKPSQDTIMWIGVPGTIFLRLLKMMIIPLIVSGIISGSAQADIKTNSKISVIAVMWALSTNIIGSTIGVTMGIAIHPGHRNITATSTKSMALLNTQDIFLDLIKNIFPDNIVNACIRKVQTTYVTAPAENKAFNETVVTRKIRNIGHADGTNILGLVFFSLVLGMATGLSKEKGLPIQNFFTSLCDAVVKVMTWFMWYTPVGIASLTAAATADIPNLQLVFIQLGYFVLSVLLGLFVLHFVVLQIAYVMFVRKNPLPFHLAIASGLVTVFTCASNAVAIPQYYQSLDKFGINKSLTRVTFPLCLSTGAGASATFIATAALFLSQVSNTELSGTSCAIIWFLTAFSVLALPAIPSASIVTVMIVTAAVGVPSDSIGLLFTVEWLFVRSHGADNLAELAESPWLMSVLRATMAPAGFVGLATPSSTREGVFHKDRLRSTTNGVCHCYGVAVLNSVCKNNHPTAETTEERQTEDVEEGEAKRLTQETSTL